MNTLGSRILVRLVTVLAALGTLITLAMALPGQAHAAAAPQVKACFVQQAPNNPSAGVGTMILHRWDGVRWLEHKRGQSNSAGCGTFSGAYANTYYSITFNRTIGSSSTKMYVLNGGTNAYATGSSGLLNLGTYYAPMTRVW